MIFIVENDRSKTVKEFHHQFAHPGKDLFELFNLLKPRSVPVIVNRSFLSKEEDRRRASSACAVVRPYRNNNEVGE